MGNNTAVILKDYKHSCYPVMAGFYLDLQRTVLVQCLRIDGTMTEWRKQISLLLDKKHLFMPCEITDAASETDYCCTSDNAVNRTHVNAAYEPYIFCLDKEIKARKNNFVVFHEKELWKIMGYLARAIKQWQIVYPNEHPGPVTASNVVLSLKGELKLVTKYSFCGCSPEEPYNTSCAPEFRQKPKPIDIFAWSQLPSFAPEDKKYSLIQTGTSFQVHPANQSRVQSALVRPISQSRNQFGGQPWQPKLNTIHEEANQSSGYRIQDLPSADDRIIDQPKHKFELHPIYRKSQKEAITASCIYSIGVIIMEAASLKLLSEIQCSVTDLNYAFNTINVTTQLKRIIALMIDDNPSRRPSLVDLLMAAKANKNKC